MNEEPYSNREIREFMKDLQKTQDKILEQVTKTNGRVTKLEMAVVAIVFLFVGLGFKYAVNVFAVI